MGGIEHGWGLQVILWFQSWRTPLVEAIALLFHYAGSEQFFLVLAPSIYWCIDASFGRRLTLLCLANGWLNNWVKEWLHRPRPYQVSSQVHNIVTEASFGIPSNHTQSATVLWGMIAHKVRRWWAVGLAALYILSMAISRMILGAHFPQDIISGMVIGLAVLALYIWGEPRVSTWLNRLSMTMQIGLLLVITATMVLVHPILFPATSSDGLSLAISYTTSFLFSGLGFILETRYVRFSSNGSSQKRLLRLCIGLAVLLGLYLGLKMLFQGLQPESGFRVLRYALLSLWAALGAPWVFVRAGLADTDIQTEK
jgi:membrane-associated phospholipid phosphatase